jgi:hypothetical protein
MLSVNIYEPTETELTFEEIGSLICLEYSKHYGKVNYINRNRHNDEITFSYKPTNLPHSNKVFLHRPWNEKLIRYVLENNRPDNTTIQYILIVPAVFGDGSYGCPRDWSAGVLYIPRKYNYVYKVSENCADILIYSDIGRKSDYRESNRLTIERRDNREEMVDDNVQHQIMKSMAPVEYDPVLAQEGYCFSDKSGSYEGVNVFKTLHTNKIQIKVSGKWVAVNDESLQEAEKHVADEYNMLVSVSRT